jgi:hypothetical protein
VVLVLQEHLLLVIMVEQQLSALTCKRVEEVEQIHQETALEEAAAEAEHQLLEQHPASQPQLSVDTFQLLLNLDLVERAAL